MLERISIDKNNQVRVISREFLFNHISIYFTYSFKEKSAKNIPAETLQ